MMEQIKETRTFAKQEFKKELEDNILSFWITRMIDDENGGFYGRINNQNQLIMDAPKGAVLNARILWTFSVAFQLDKNEIYRSTATRAFQYLKSNFLDSKNGGLYWMLDSTGKAVETKKQIYAQAFGIYALSEFHKIAPKAGALDMALLLFQCIETYSFDISRNGYFEAYDETWNLLEDLRLSDKDANEAKTMNTHLHILEAYTTLYEINKEPLIGKQLRNLIELFFDKFLNESYHFHLFFDENWVLKSDEVSYGHDIEASWLIHEAAKVLGDKKLIQRCEDMAVLVAEATLPFFDEDGGLFHAGNQQGVLYKEKHWWPQAEALVGLVNAFRLSGNKQFQHMAEKCWEFINDYLVDTVHQEWIWGVDEQGVPMSSEDKAGPWKCPYHNGRAMIELIRRI